MIPPPHAECICEALGGYRASTEEALYGYIHALDAVRIYPQDGSSRYAADVSEDRLFGWLYILKMYEELQCSLA